MNIYTIQVYIVHREFFTKKPINSDILFYFMYLLTYLFIYLFIYRGTSGIDIDLRRVDIDQCPQRNTGSSQPLNIFAGTDKCKQRTTEVKFHFILIKLNFLK